VIPPIPHPPPMVSLPCNGALLAAILQMTSSMTPSVQAGSLANDHGDDRCDDHGKHSAGRHHMAIVQPATALDAIKCVYFIGSLLHSTERVRN